jgi:hypothetical protein
MAVLGICLPYREGRPESHPALPQDASRHKELERILDKTLLTDPRKAFTRVGRFEPLGKQSLPEGVLRALQVQWTERQS